MKRKADNNLNPNIVKKRLLLSKDNQEDPTPLILKATAKKITDSINEHLPRKINGKDWKFLQPLILYVYLKKEMINHFNAELGLRIEKSLLKIIDIDDFEMLEAKCKMLKNSNYNVPHYDFMLWLQQHNEVKQATNDKINSIITLDYI